MNNDLLIAGIAFTMFAVLFIFGATPIGVTLNTTWTDTVDSSDLTIPCNASPVSVSLGTVDVTNALPLTKRVRAPADQLCIPTEGYQYNPLQYNGDRQSVLSVDRAATYNVTAQVSCTGPRRINGGQDRSSINVSTVRVVQGSCDDPDRVVATIPVR